MPLPVLESVYLLQSLGWAIANSFWQTGLLWLLYQLITNTDKKLPALVKHNLSVVLLASSFLWFVFTIVQNYRVLSTTSVSHEIFLKDAWALKIQSFSNGLPFLSIVYLILLCFYTIRFFRNLSANHLLQTEGLTKAPIDFRLFVAKTALHLGIKKNIRVWLSGHVDVPSVTGFIKPVILLPVAIVNHLSTQQIEAILLHELAHIKRNDYLVNFLQSVVELILFFNPFAVLLSKAAKKERENCCDDWVISFRYDHYEYAKALLVLEEQRHFLPFRFALAATNGKKNLLRRVKRLFKTAPQTNFSSLQKAKLMGLCFLLLTAMFILIPCVTNKPADESTRVYNKTEKPALVKFNELPAEMPSKSIFRSLPTKSLTGKRPVSTYKKTKPKPLNKSSADYVNAFINEELLNPINQIPPVATQVIEKEIKNLRYLIKIEEQQSGENQTNIYYFELNNKNGNTALKPLIMLNKIKMTVKKPVFGNLPDSLDTSTRPNNKKRITS